MKNRRKVVKVVPAVISIAVILSAAKIFPEVSLKNKYKDSVIANSYIYSEELNIYNNFLKDYADYIKSLNLNDLEIILKIMKDQWNDIEGYGKAENLINGHFRLSFQEEGKGVCTSFADDFTARINAINSKYNARNIVVYLEDILVDKEIIDIERKMIVGEDNISTKDEDYQRKNGNHMVSAVFIPENNITLIVDPTNLFIGYLNKGEINIFNVDLNCMDIIYNTTCKLSDKTYLELFGNYISTLQKPTINEEKIIENYGIEAQQEAFGNIETIDEKVQRKVFLKK